MVYDNGEMMKLAQSSVPYDYVTMVNKPPKPPCWRDFVPQGNSARSSKDPSQLPLFTDLSQVSHKGSPQPDQLTLFGLGTTSSDNVTHAHSLIQNSHAHTSNSTSAKSHKKHRSKLGSKLHRTRSEISIEKCDIPDMNRTITLAETKPREFGLRRTQFDAHVYIQENTKRCERWLEQVRASRPLEDVHFSKGAGVELEIPDEEFGVCGHSSDLGSDMDSASVDYDMGTSHSLPRTSRSRSRHRDHQHKARTLPISASHVHIESITESAETKDTSADNGDRIADTTKRRDVHHAVDNNRDDESVTKIKSDTTESRSFKIRDGVTSPTDCEERISQRWR